MKRMILFLIFISGYVSSTWSQQQLNYVSISFTNHHPVKPFGSFSKLFYGEIHPGVEVATGFAWKSRLHHQWVQDVHIGYFYHQWIQHAINLHTTFGYRYLFNQKTAAGASVGAGYLHAIPDTQIFELTEAGAFKQKNNAGRPQALAVFTLQFQQRISPQFNFIAAYEQKLQFPFINEYVPLLPYAAFKIGVSRNLHSKNKQP